MREARSMKQHDALHAAGPQSCTGVLCRNRARQAIWWRCPPRAKTLTAHLTAHGLGVRTSKDVAACRAFATWVVGPGPRDDG